jgi:twitching motility two-component system response regulator PilH
MNIRHILVVDDSATERFYIKNLLNKHGFQVSTAENSEDAILKIKDNKPDLILMDIVMPGENGFRATRAISKDPETQHIPIIICTSKQEETDRIWGLRQGARDYITKPLDIQELLNKINAVAL